MSKIIYGSIAALLAILFYVDTASAQSMTQDGGQAQESITTALPDHIANQKARMPAVAVYSPSKGDVWDPLTDAMHTTGGSAGTASNASDAQATSTTNGQALAWLMGYNGATWDRLRVDGSKNLDVNCIVGCTTGGALETGGNLASIKADVDKIPASPAQEGGNLASVATNTNRIPAQGSAAKAASTPVIMSTDTALCPNSVAINQTASTDVLTLTNKAYVCGVILITASAQSVSLVEGTGSVCATGIAALLGGATASMAFGANGGIDSVAGTPWLKSKTAADHLCVLQSGAGNVSGVITYADLP